MNESLLEEADRIVSTDRQRDYGHPFDNFTQTGRLWGAILNIPDVSAENVALCMVAVKISRQTHAPTRDNLVDMAGYAKTVDLVIDERARRSGR
jgi:hypothetical protein